MGARRRGLTVLGVMWLGTAVLLVVAAVRHDWGYVVAAGIWLLNSLVVVRMLSESTGTDTEPTPVSPSPRWAPPPPTRRGLRWQLGGVLTLFAFFAGVLITLAVLGQWWAVAVYVPITVVNLRWLPRWWSRWRRQVRETAA